MQPTINERGDACYIDMPVLRMKRKLSKLPNSQSDYSIFRVHSHLRIANEKCYEPGIISIGPYHRYSYNRREDNQMNAMMEEKKWHYLQSLLKRRSESVEKYVKAVRDLEEKARKCYDELPQELMNSQEFIEMMLLDGCFIIELFRKVNDRSLIDHKDPIFEMNWLRNALERDLMLFENQIPFFVLYKLFELSSNDDDDDLIKLAVNFFLPLLPGDGHLAANSDEIDWSGKAKNLLELIYHNWLPPFAGTKILVPAEKGIKNKNLGLIQCASELVKSGIKFSKRSNESCLLDITFVKGTLHIPCITIESRTECFLRNLIAYEEYYQDIRDSHIISYVKFLDCLIQSPKDVKILVQEGIIDNWLGDDEAVSKIFNNINHRVTAPTAESFQYREIFNEVNLYCNRTVHKRWITNLNRKYLKCLRTSVVLITCLLQIIYIYIMLIRSNISICMFNAK